MRNTDIIRWCLAALIVAGLCWQIVAHPPGDWSVLGAPDLLPLIFAALAATASHVAMATSWAHTRHRGESWLDVGGAWFPSLLARYVPGGIWQGAVRVLEGRARRERVSDNVAAFLFEQALACASAASLALFSLAAGPPIPVWLVIGLVATTTVAAGSLIALTRVTPSLRWSTKAFAWTLLGHGLIAVAFAALVSSFAPGGPVGFLLSARTFLIAGLAGVLAVFVPAGLGVREGVLAWMLAPRLGIGATLAIALLARVGLVGCEIAAWGIWAAGKKLAR
jgi:hypothetical protein